MNYLCDPRCSGLRCPHSLLPLAQGGPRGDTGSGSQRPPTCGRCQVPLLSRGSRSAPRGLPFILSALRARTGSLGEIAGHPTSRSVCSPSPAPSKLPSHPDVCRRRALDPLTPRFSRAPLSWGAGRPEVQCLALTWADVSQTRPQKAGRAFFRDTLKMTQCIVRTPLGMGSWGTGPEPPTEGLQCPLPLLTSMPQATLQRGQS